MAETNLFVKADRFAEIVQDSNALTIFLSIAKNRIRNYDELVEDTELDFDIIAPLVTKLKEGHFIKQNPNKLSNKFKLAFNGQLFAEQLKRGYPEVQELLGETSLIEPIQINDK